jgi:hypothetical protein
VPNGFTVCKAESLLSFAFVKKSSLFEFDQYCIQLPSQLILKHLSHMGKPFNIIDSISSFPQNVLLSKHQYEKVEHLIMHSPVQYGGRPLDAILSPIPQYALSPTSCKR